ncbi:DUF2156 domain-containing protein [Massilioclostridium coli]|uniref:DUF2156 domain-containing protein n=1 Tax=Massilioclostridium coli TaxID=1870991 RepID=UPI00085C62D9|nr:phosphatidylglycerol lysyltransferase domain-containing protein [Massilioclostridium coli]
MLELKEIELTDKPWVDELLSYSDFRGCEYSFSTMFLWKFIYKTRIARVGDRLIVGSMVDGKISFLFPPGKGELRPVIQAMEEYSVQLGQPFYLHSVNKQAQEQLEQEFPGKFEFTETRDYFDYIYFTEKLTTLSGKKLHSKRNHINRFLENNEGRWSYEPITPENKEECRQMNKRWCAVNDCLMDDEKLSEQCAVAQAFRHFDALGLKGGLIRVDGEVVAYCMGEPLNSDTFVVHIEKAMSEIQGAYPIINQQFVKNTCQDYQYINREDDTGAEGLRKAKLSYYPALLEEKCNAVAVR